MAILLLIIALIFVLLSFVLYNWGDKNYKKFEAEYQEWLRKRGL
jgi:hypothetical protein